MIEEAKIREEIEERTGVSSRGFLVPPKNVRQEVQGMLSKGSQSDKRKDLVRYYILRDENFGRRIITATARWA